MQGFGCGDPKNVNIASATENEMEKNMENNMETGFGIWGPGFPSHYWDIEKQNGNYYNGLYRV